MAAVFKEPPSAPAECLNDAGLASQVLLPSDPDYAVREDSYWCNDAKLGPACIVRPRSAEDVSTALKALISAGQKFAVRSGGHTNWAGANNITNGVTVFQPLLPH
jgi:FAD/FMN-containing dehydrogenase